MIKKFVLLSMCVAVCTLTLGCGGGGGSTPEQEAAGKQAILDAAAQIQKQKAEKGQK